MQLKWTLVATHGVVAAAGALACSLTAGQGVATAAVWSAGALGVCVAAGLGVYRWISGGFTRLEQQVAAGNSLGTTHTGISELDQVSTNLQDGVHRWADAANKYRRQVKEIDDLMNRLDGVGSAGGERDFGSVAERVRNALGRLASECGSSVQQMLNQASELRETTQQLALETDDQADAVVKSTNSVEQLSSHCTAVSGHVTAARDTSVTARDAASNAQNLLAELNDGMKQLKGQVQRGEKRLGVLGDRTREIGKIVETIGAISSRTDMLALNASIESYRAGEQGRGFAVVAEEVRTLAEQAAQASREIAGLIDSIQFETQESITAMSDQNSRVISELGRVSAASRELDRIRETCGHSAEHVGEIDRLSADQLSSIKELVGSVEKISNVARHNRRRAESVGWAMQNLTQLTERFDQSLDSLRDKPAPGSTTQSAAHASRHGKPASAASAPVASQEALNLLEKIGAE